MGAPRHGGSFKLSQVTRTSYEIEYELQARFNDMVPWGLKSHVIRNMIHNLVNQVEEGNRKLLEDLIHQHP